MLNLRLIVIFYQCKFSEMICIITFNMRNW